MTMTTNQPTEQELRILKQSISFLHIDIRQKTRELGISLKRAAELEEVKAKLEAEMRNAENTTTDGQGSECEEEAYRED